MCKRKYKRGGIPVTGNEKEKKNQLTLKDFILPHYNFAQWPTSLKIVIPVLTELMVFILIPSNTFCSTVFVNFNTILSCCSFLTIVTPSSTTLSPKSLAFYSRPSSICSLATSPLPPAQLLVLSTSCFRHTETFTLFQVEQFISHFYAFVYLVFLTRITFFLFYL